MNATTAGADQAFLRDPLLKFASTIVATAPWSVAQSIKGRAAAAVSPLTQGLRLQIQSSGCLARRQHSVCIVGLHFIPPVDNVREELSLCQSNLLIIIRLMRVPACSCVFLRVYVWLLFWKNSTAAVHLGLFEINEKLVPALFELDGGQVG